MTADRFASARTIADAVLFEGYVLYPYRASARKNQLRWQFGVLAPPAYVAAAGGERMSMRTEVIVDPGSAPVLHVRVRCLQVQRRVLEAAHHVDGVDGVDGFTPTDELPLDDALWVPWDEAVVHDLEVGAVALLPLADAPRLEPFTLDAGDEVELLRAADGTTRGRAIRRRELLSGLVRVDAQWAAGPGALLKVSVTVENTATWYEPDAVRDDVVRRSLVAVHTLLAIDDGAFVSMLDPPEDAEVAAASCVSDGTFPVLVGPPDSHDVVLSSPIILYDHPQIAPESPGDLFDATEIDEILALRVLTLTEEERAEARGTDPRAAAILDRVDDMPPELWERLHGAVRSLQPASIAPVAAEPEFRPWWDPRVDREVDPWTDRTVVAGVLVGKGTKVWLRPSRRADAHDLFLADRLASVVGVFRDVDGNEHIAVTVDDDPATEYLDWQGRYLYFHPDEVEPVTSAEAGR
jgi:hypothetical protein